MMTMDSANPITRSRNSSGGAHLEYGTPFAIPKTYNVYDAAPKLRRTTRRVAIKH